MGRALITCFDVINGNNNNNNNQRLKGSATGGVGAQFMMDERVTGDHQEMGYLF